MFCLRLVAAVLLLFCAYARAARLDVTATVRELLVVRETVFPSLETEVVARLSLRDTTPRFAGRD